MSVTHEISGGTTHLSGNPIQIKLTASAALTKHKLALKLTIRTMTDVEMPNSPVVAEIAPANLVSVFEDISGFVDYPITNNMEYPPIGALIENRISFKVNIEIGEIWTDDNGDRQEEFVTPATDNLIKILKGRLRPYDLARLNTAGTNFHEKYIVGNLFLTSLPNFFKVLPNHTPLVYFLPPWWGTEREITMNVNVYCSDPLQNTQLTQTFTIWSITDLLGCCMQPYFWKGWEPAGDAKLISYEFWLSWDGGESEKRVFVIDYNYYPQVFTFYYVNQLSGIDLIWFSGEYVQGLKTESETMYKPVPYGAGVNTASLTTISSSGQKRWELNTGNKSREDLLAMRDFLESKEQWMIDPDDNNLLIPVKVEPGDFKLFNSMEDLQCLDLVITEAHK